MERNKQFDEQIRQKLGNLEAGFDPASWELLAHKMDFNAQQELDDLLKDRLNSFEAPMVSAASWEAMEQLIDANEAIEKIEAESELDQVAYERLHNIQVPYQGRHWALMAKRLEEEFSLRHKLYRYKVAEVALMALLILTFVRFAPMINGWLGNEFISDASQTELLLDTNRNGSISNFASAGMSNTSVPKEIDDNQEGPTTNQTNSISKAGVLPPGSNFGINDNGGEEIRTNLLGLPVISLGPITSLEENKNPVILENEFDQNKEVREEVLISELPVVTTQLVNPIFSWELPTVEKNPFNINKNLRFGIFATTDLNYILTPPDQLSVFDTLVETAPNATMASGYGGGVTVNFKKDRWEFQTGGIYSFKRYIPNTPIFIFETLNFYIKEDFHGIQLDIFQLPLNAHYHFKNRGNWRFYASAGASAHFITSNVYEIGYERLALGGFPNPPSSPDDTKSIRQEKDFPDGLIDGGSLNDNFYMTANIGLGVERYVSPKWSVFFQPNYQHYLMSRGIGTNNDKIYTTSFHLGTKFNLK